MDESGVDARQLILKGLTQSAKSHGYDHESAWTQWSKATSGEAVKL